MQKGYSRTNILYFFSSNQIGWIENGRYFIFSGANRPRKFWALVVRTFHSWSSPLRCIYFTWQPPRCQMNRFSNNNPLRIVSVRLQKRWTISWMADIICLSVFVLYMSMDIRFIAPLWELWTFFCTKNWNIRKGGQRHQSRATKQTKNLRK